MKLQSIPLINSWKKVLKPEIDKPYFKSILKQLDYLDNHLPPYYPERKLIFNAFNLCPFEKIKVVILGQDPYHNPGEAMGLSFSVPRSSKVPPSLKNIYKELHADISMPIPEHGDLTSWTEQGVLLLNSCLTVLENKPGSHKKLGWVRFTDAVISLLSLKKKNLVFLLWGNYAKSKEKLIDQNKHLVLTSAHPSPLAGKAFFNQNHFSKTNEYLMENDLMKIEWTL
jgi:uracil-DNA glycosylase